MTVLAILGTVILFLVLLACVCVIFYGIFIAPIIAAGNVFSKRIDNLFDKHKK